MRSTHSLVQIHNTYQLWGLVSVICENTWEKKLTMRKLSNLFTGLGAGCKPVMFNLTKRALANQFFTAVLKQVIDLSCFISINFLRTQPAWYQNHSLQQTCLNRSCFFTLLKTQDLYDHLNFFFQLLCFGNDDCGSVPGYLFSPHQSGMDLNRI